MEKEKESKYTRPQRIAALVCVILIVIAVIAALVLNLMPYTWAKTAGRIALGFVLVIPILTWVYIWMVGNLTRKHTIADFDFGGTPTDHSGILPDASDKETK